MGDRLTFFSSAVFKTPGRYKRISLTFSVHYSYIDLLRCFHCHGPLRTWENDLKGFVAFKAVIRVNDTYFNFLVNLSRSKCQLLPSSSLVVFVCFRCQAFHIIAKKIQHRQQISLLIQKEILCFWLAEILRLILPQSGNVDLIFFEGVCNIRQNDVSATGYMHEKAPQPRSSVAKLR